MKKEKILIIAIALIFILILGLIIIYFTKDIQLAPGDNNADFVSQIVPATMQAGQPYEIRATYRNTGILPWTIDGSYYLGNPYFGQATTFGSGRIPLNSFDSIQPGQTKEFSYFISAPGDAGTYTLQLQMVQEGIEWFGQISPTAQVTVTDNRLGNFGDVDLEPVTAWIKQSSSGQGVWLINRPNGGAPGDAGVPCANGFGWQNTYLMASKENFDGTISRKKITGDNCLGGIETNINPWGDTPDLYQQVSGGWTIIKSSGLRISPVTGRALEEYYPYSGGIVIPDEIVPDGKKHVFQKCYQNDTVYFNEQGEGEVCYDATCVGDSCPGKNVLINREYIVYDYCEGSLCYANGDLINSPVYFAARVDSVLRTSYTLVGGTICTAAPLLTEEQWYAEGIGFVGFDHNYPASPAPGSVDFYGFFESNQCLPYWDQLCKINPYNYNSCCPPGHLDCNVYQSDMTLPTVSLTNPSEGATMGATVNLAASAADNVGVTKLEFYVNNRLINTDLNAPYNFNWDTSIVSNGEKKITARAYDTSGNYITTPITRININNDINDARFVNQNVPTSLTVGQNYTVNLTMRNIGTKPWDQTQNYRLVSQSTNWNVIEINLSNAEVINNGQERTFSFMIAAPATPGNYEFNFRMQQGNAQFGDNNPTTNIIVNSLPSTTTGGSTGSSGSSSSSGSSGGSTGRPAPKPQCNDNIDNDNDGNIDYPEDSDCTSINGNSEFNISQPPTNTIVSEEVPQTEGFERESNIRIVFWIVILVLVLGIAFVAGAIMRELLWKRRFEKINQDVKPIFTNEPNVY